MCQQVEAMRTMRLHVLKFLPLYPCLTSLVVGEHEPNQISGGLRERRACAVVDALTRRRVKKKGGRFT
jgi:hypothetical protein